MRITGDGDRLVIEDTPGCLWLFGFVFVVSGTVVLAMPWIAENWATLRAWERLVALGIGLAHFSAGVWMILRHSATRVELDRAGNAGTHEVRRPFARRSAVTRFPLDEVRAVDIARSKDSDGDPMFQLRLWLSGSRVLPLQAQPAHGEERARERAAEIRGFLRLQEPGEAGTIPGRA
ncbi:MAG TPA: hypothetical protein VKA84_19000 [Gemmatimonadaceae bacterium]|nr:hypothetical protein [Gemmatimonadaceae bacterium]